MCNPVAVLALTAVSGYMQYQQGANQAAAIKSESANNAKIAEFNAQQDEVAATDATRRGAQDAGQVRENTRRAVATGRAITAGSGLLADTGTTGDLQAQNAETGEFNAATVMDNAERQAYGFKAQADSTRFGSKVAQNNAIYQARVARQNGLLSAAGTLITGATNYGLSSGVGSGSFKQTSIGQSAYRATSSNYGPGF